MDQHRRRKHWLWSGWFAFSRLIRKLDRFGDLLLLLRHGHKFFYDFSFQNNFQRWSIRVVLLLLQLRRWLIKVRTVIWPFGCCRRLRIANARARLWLHWLPETIVDKRFLTFERLLVIRIHNQSWLWRKYKWLYKVLSTFLCTASTALG